MTETINQKIKVFQQSSVLVVVSCGNSLQLMQMVLVQMQCQSMTDVDGMLPFMPNSDKVRPDPSTFNNSLMFFAIIFV